MNNKKPSMNLQIMIMTGMLAAIAGVLMSFGEFALPMMPPFYKVDFSDVPSIIALFLFGPVSASLVELIKIIIKVITTGSSSMYVGEIANLIGIVLFVVPIWLVYKKGGQTRKAAGVSLLISIPIRIAMSCCINAFITLPMYASAMGKSMDEIIQMVGAANPAIKNLPTFIILATIPFNFIKNGLNNLIGWLLYDRLGKLNMIAKIRNNQF